MSAWSLASELALMVTRERLGLAAKYLEEIAPDQWPVGSDRVIMVATSPKARRKLEQFLEQAVPVAGPAGAAMALRCAAETAEETRRNLHLEPVWTGPESRELATRQTAQALLELVESAQEKLLIVSYAIYNVKQFEAPLTEALERDVAITVIPDHTWQESKKELVKLAGLGKKGRQGISFYCWPEENRGTYKGRAAYASLHAKCAVADTGKLLMGSANLTERAMERNMELGLLVTGGSLPKQIADHFDSLIREKVLRPLNMPS